MPLIFPFPREHYYLLWSWLQEFPVCNFDDDGPRDLTQMARFMEDLRKRGRQMWEVVQSGQPVGIIGYEQETPTVGCFRGICFTKSVHGTGIPLMAVAEVLDKAFTVGTEKVRAEYFADNLRVRAFLQKFGAVDEQLVNSERLRGGKVVAWRVVGISACDFQRNQRLRSYQEHSRPSQGVLASA